MGGIYFGDFYVLGFGVMTPRQQHIFMIIEGWWKKFGYGPSIDEIMMLSKDKSRSNVSRLIKELTKCGAVKKTPGKWRSVRPSYVRYRDLGEE